jgi:hypothetical protein
MPSQKKLFDPILVGAMDYTVGAEKPVALFFFCPHCWRRYFAGMLTEAQANQSVYFAHQTSKSRYRCVLCAGDVEPYAGEANRVPHVPKVTRRQVPLQTEVLF